MVKDLKEKLDKYDNEKKGAAKVEKAKREAVASRQEQEKKWADTSQNALHSIKYLNYDQFYIAGNWKISYRKFNSNLRKLPLRARG